MATRPATGRLRRPSAMQLNSHRHRIGRKHKRPVRYLLADPCAAGFSDWTRSAGRYCRRMLLEPAIVVAAVWGSAQPSALRVIELYQGLVRPFRRLGKAYELRCGKPYARTIAASVDRR